MYKTLHKKQGSVTVQLRFARSSVTFCAKRDNMLAQSMNYSAAYLSRLIKKNTGQSFSELLLDLRLKKSMELLRLTDMRINDIAAKAGYNDVSYFISIFKKCTGVTPKEWRSLAKLGEL